METMSKADCQKVKNRKTEPPNKVELGLQAKLYQSFAVLAGARMLLFKSRIGSRAYFLTSHLKLLNNLLIRYQINKSRENLSYSV